MPKTARASVGGMACHGDQDLWEGDTLRLLAPMERLCPTACMTLDATRPAFRLGLVCDTAEFAMAAIRRWWKRLGEKRHGSPKRLLITADSGGNNSSWTRLWKMELQRFADKTGMIIRGLSLSPRNQQVE